MRNVRSPNIVLAQIVSTSLEADEIVRTVAAALDLPHEDSKATVLKRIQDFLVACHDGGKRVLLLVDEAQNLPANSLEELRMLSNFMSAEKPLLQTFLLGQPEFRKTLLSPMLDQLRQRIIASCHLGPLDELETEAYVLHRLRIVGWRNDPSFDRGVFPVIYRHTGGIPRRINMLCDRLLLMGCLERKHNLTAVDLAEVLNELKQELAFADLASNPQNEY